MSKESRIHDQEIQFRSLGALAWTKNTIYPRDRERFGTFRPHGQCGITNFGLGVWLVWRGLASPNCLLYVEGQVYDAAGELIDDKHAWLMRRKAFSKWLKHTDLALSQYEGISQEVTTGGTYAVEVGNPTIP